MSRLLALVCLLVSVAVLWLDARDSGRAIEGYPLIAALGIMFCVILLALHIYAEKNTIPENGKEFVDRFLSELKVASLGEAKRLIGNAVRSDTDAKDARERLRTVERERQTANRERDKAIRGEAAVQKKLDKMSPRLEELELREKDRQTTADAVGAVEKELAKVRAELATAEAAILRLEGELGTATQLAADTEVKRKEAEAQRVKLEEQVREANGRIEVLNGQLQAQPTTPTVEPEVLSALREEKEALEVRLEEAAPKLRLLAELEPKHARALTDFGEAERVKAEAVRRAEQLQEQLNQLGRENTRATKEAERLQQALDEQQRQVGVKQKEFDAALKAAQDGLGEATAEIGRLRENPPGLAAANQKVLGLEDEVRKLTAAGVTLRGQLEGQGKLLTEKATALEAAEREVGKKDQQLAGQRSQLLRIPDLERGVAEADQLRSRLAVMEIGDRELNGVTLRELRDARDAVVEILDMEELGLRQLNFSLIYAMALRPGPELKALGIRTAELVEYVARAYDDVLDFNPDRLRSLLQKKGKIPVAAWNQYVRLKKQRERAAQHSAKPPNPC